MPEIHDTLQLLQAGQRRIESKLDLLLEALAADDDEPSPVRTLDGEVAGRDRDQGASLDG